MQCSACGCEKFSQESFYVQRRALFVKFLVTTCPKCGCFLYQGRGKYQQKDKLYVSRNPKENTEQNAILSVPETETFKANVEQLKENLQNFNFAISYWVNVFEENVQKARDEAENSSVAENLYDGNWLLGFMVGINSLTMSRKAFLTTQRELFWAYTRYKTTLERFNQQFKQVAGTELIQAVEKADNEVEETIDETYQLCKEDSRSVGFKHFKIFAVAAGKFLIGSALLGLSLGAGIATASFPKTEAVETKWVTVDKYGNEI